MLVTGASVGIGRKVAERLAAEGYFVFAGARKEQDLKALDAIANVKAVRLDVTIPAEVAAAVEVVRSSGLPLHGIVNNAGVAVVDPVLSTSEADFDFQMQVNVYGVFRVTKAFAPLVVASKGRIVNISSISAFLSDGGTSAYTMSKAAVEAFTNVLATEMAPLGVSVIAVEPGAYNTDILKPALARSVTKGFEADRSAMKPPDEVATAVLQALSDPEAEAALHDRAGAGAGRRHHQGRRRRADAAECGPGLHVRPCRAEPDDGRSGDEECEEYT